MNLRKLAATVAATVALIGSVLVASPAMAVNTTTPSDLYFPNTGTNGSSCNASTGQKFVDATSNPLDQYSPGLAGADGYQVTIHNLCGGTIYIYYGEAGSWDALGPSQSATYTLTNGAATVQAAASSNGTNLLANIYKTALPDVTTTGSNASTTLSTSSISTAVNGVFVIQNNGSNTLNVSGNSGGIRQGGQTCMLGAPCTISAGTNLSFSVIAQGTIRVGSATLTIGSGGGGGGANGSGSGSASTNSSPSAMQTLSLAVTTDNTSCTGGNPTGYSGAWLTLPSADQCTQTGPTAKANATLLGWSTAANFPVARAQAQIDAHWGVIDEEIDGVRMIFIPAGMATFVSGSNTLYPVWSA